MKKQAINFSWPAGLSDFSTDTKQENFSRGKLRVFYKGETADHRYFSDAFAEDLVKTLPYTPIVSHYSEEDDDFVGHATEQNIYGIVDPCSKCTFEQDEQGRTWCVCDVVLYTERPDATGEIAKKIVGHKQSLELDPHTVKYVVNYDEKKHFKNIEFTAGTFVGVSVLGNNQEPAFTDSAFFSYDADFEKKMQILRDYCEHKQDQTQNGGDKMNLKEFMQLSWGDVSEKVAEAINREYGDDAYTMMVDMFEDSAIVRFFYYMDGSQKLMRINYVCDENGNVTLNGINEVHITYEDVEPSVSLQPEIDTEQPNEADAGFDTTEESETSTVVEDNSSTEQVETVTTMEETVDNTSTETTTEVVETAEVSTTETVQVEENINETNIEVQTAEENTDNFNVVDPAQVSSVEIAPETEKGTVNEQEENQTSSSTAFTESERAEFEALKKGQKVALVNSYKDNLSDEDFSRFMNIAEQNEMDEKELELELLKAYKKAQEEVKPMRAFAFAPVTNNAKTNDPLDSYISRQLKR